MQHRFFAKVITHHFRHKVVNSLVICRTVAGSIDNCHIACPVSAHYAGYADKAFGQKGCRVKIFVADAAVNRTDALCAFFAAVINLVIFNKQVAAFGKHRTAQFRQITVFKISCVVAPRRKNNINAAGVYIVHHPAQKRAVIAVIHNIMLAERFRAAPAAQPARN